MTDSMSEPSKMKVNMSRNGDGEKPRMVKLGELLTLDAEPERIDNPADETFVTVRTKCGGAVERVIKDGKIPVAFTGYRIHEGQLIYSRIDARNNAFAIVPSELDGAVVSKDFPVFRVDERKALKSYLMHFFRSGRLQYAIQQYSKGITNRQRIKEEVLLSFSIPLPSLEEQRRIVAVLDRADAIRAKRRQILADLDELPRSLFAEMFGEERADEVRVANCCTIVTGNTPSRQHPEYYGDAIEWVKTDNITESGIETAREGLSEAGRLLGRVVPAGSLLMVCIAGSVRSIGRVAISDREVAINQQINALIPHRNVEPLYLLYVLKSQKQYLVSDISMQLKGILNKSKLGEKKIPLPPIELQKEFARRVEAIAAARAKVERALALDDELFAALQSRAFRGAL